jgi:hypothetical protein
MIGVRGSRTRLRAERLSSVIWKALPVLQVGGMRFLPLFLAAASNFGCQARKARHSRSVQPLITVRPVAPIRAEYPSFPAWIVALPEPANPNARYAPPARISAGKRLANQSLDRYLPLWSLR